jgi:hypothetical protein
VKLDGCLSATSERRRIAGDQARRSAACRPRIAGDAGAHPGDDRRSELRWPVSAAARAGGRGHDRGRRGLPVFPRPSGQPSSGSSRAGTPPTSRRSSPTIRSAPPGGLKGPNAHLLKVFRHRLAFPDLERAVIDQDALFSPEVVLIEDRASGTQLIQALIEKGPIAGNALCAGRRQDHAPACPDGDDRERLRLAAARGALARRIFARTHAVPRRPARRPGRLDRPGARLDQKPPARTEWRSAGAGWRRRKQRLTLHEAKCSACVRHEPISTSGNERAQKTITCVPSFGAVSIGWQADVAGFVPTTAAGMSRGHGAPPRKARSRPLARLSNARVTRAQTARRDAGAGDADFTALTVRVTG